MILQQPFDAEQTITGFRRVGKVQTGTIADNSSLNCTMPFDFVAA
jgi:hypothetical protein